MSIIIAGVVDVAPDARDAALADAQPLIEAALAEAGCRAYAWTADPAVAGRIHVFEQWDSTETLAAHFDGAPYRGMLAHLQGVGIIAAETRKYRVDLIEPVYDPEGRPRADFFSA